MGPIDLLLGDSSCLDVCRFFHLLCLIDCLELEKTSLFMAAVLKSLYCNCSFDPNNLWPCLSFLGQNIGAPYPLTCILVSFCSKHFVRYLSATLLNVRYHRLRVAVSEVGRDGFDLFRRDAWYCLVCKLVLV